MPDPIINLRVPASMLERMNVVAPPGYWARSRFVREAIQEKLDRLAELAADPALHQEARKW